MATTISDIGLTQDHVMEFIQQRLAAKRRSLNKWRNRYSATAYPKKMASNVMGSSIWASTLAAEAGSYFDGSNAKPDIQSALSSVQASSQQLNQRIAQRVDDRVQGNIDSLGPNAEGLQYDALMQAASVGANGNNQAVEKIEYNWVFNALQGNLLELWLSAGLVGMTKQRAFKELFYFVDADATLRNKTEIHGIFGQLSGAVLSAPDAYRQMPPLW